jgi:hypothetical protein
MITKPRIVDALLRLYPEAWRREYGPELSDLLLSKPLGARVVADVALGGLRQQVRTAPPWAILGVSALVVLAGQLAWTLRGAMTFEQGLSVLVQPSGITLPTYVFAPMATNLYAIALQICGWWTHVRHGGTASQSGRAAVKMSMLAGAPVIVLGLMMLAEPRAAAPSAIEVMAAPLFALPQSWLHGYIAGAIACRLVRREAAGS